MSLTAYEKDVQIVAGPSMRGTKLFRVNFEKKSLMA